MYKIKPERSNPELNRESTFFPTIEPIIKTKHTVDKSGTNFVPSSMTLGRNLLHNNPKTIGNYNHLKYKKKHS